MDREVLKETRLSEQWTKGKGYRPPWYRRWKVAIRSAVLNIHQDSGHLTLSLEPQSYRSTSLALRNQLGDGLAGDLC